MSLDEVQVGPLSFTLFQAGLCLPLVLLFLSSAADVSRFKSIPLNYMDVRKVCI